MNKVCVDFADATLFGKKLKNENDFYKKNSGSVRYGKDDIDGTKGWKIPPAAGQ